MDEENKQINTNTDTEKGELEKLKKQNDEYLNGWKRAKADYINLKKETESQNKEIKEWMSKIMTLPLLVIMDSFEKAVSEIPDDLKNNQWVKGVENIKKQLEDYLKMQHIESISILANGEKFDPMKHEAMESAEGGESGKIAEELQKGYLINGEVLRPAKVRVYK